MKNKKYPVQFIWAGKPYPLDYPAIAEFNNLVHISKQYPNMAVCVGYELTLSKQLKHAADLWLNNPRVPREASGTSGMTAAMNGAVNITTNDGWIREFALFKYNGFTVPLIDYESMSVEEQDDYDCDKLFTMLEKEILPMFYDHPEKWKNIQWKGMTDVKIHFNSNRMAEEYYNELYEKLPGKEE